MVEKGRKQTRDKTTMYEILSEHKKATHISSNQPSNEQRWQQLSTQRETGFCDKCAFWEFETNRRAQNRRWATTTTIDSRKNFIHQNNVSWILYLRLWRVWLKTRVCSWRTSKYFKFFGLLRFKSLTETPRQTRWTNVNSTQISQIKCCTVSRSRGSLNISFVK